MQKPYTMPKPYREPFWTYEREERIREWFQKPLTPRGEFFAAVVVGAVSFFLLFLVYMLR